MNRSALEIVHLTFLVTSLRSFIDVHQTVPLRSFDGNNVFRSTNMFFVIYNMNYYQVLVHIYTLSCTVNDGYE